MKKEQSLQHLIVTEMPYELLKLLIEKKALHKFIVNTIDSHSTLDDFSQRYQITLLMRKSTPNIIISAFRWYNTMNTSFWYILYKESCKRILEQLI